MEKEKKILVVDDDRAILEMLGEVLSYYGYQVSTLARAEMVFDRIKEYNPDLILMDIMLAGMDGRTICRAIKSVEDVSNIPIILISASESGASCLNREGAPDDFVQKPFDVSFLIEKIEHQLAA
ncbi:response regulator [Mucilaginibacter mali]|uniref:Response regulator n=1 Tax=Mucilaginibacter mali TaxID=2740462 RepID=A0A7D4UJ92_9SPHI|nr:response regulator [Mucilaginibacter mali]QKJ28722.1 response regulator [Mucilaginibacter mali]